MTGSVFGTSDGGDGPYTQTPYNLQTTAIESVEEIIDYEILDVSVYGSLC